MSDTPILDALIKKHMLCCNICPQFVYALEKQEIQMKLLETLTKDKPFTPATANNPNGWRTFDEWTPIYNVQLLVYREGGFFDIGVILPSGELINALGNELINMTHWIYLPEPPKETK